MNEIYKNNLSLIRNIADLAEICKNFKTNPTNENGEKIIQSVDNCEKKWLKAKEKIVIMVTDVEIREKNSKQEISVVETGNGFLIKE